VTSECDNGWPEYKKAVLWRLDDMEKRISAIDRKLWGVMAGVVFVGLKAVFDLIVR
jgi:hypothetical protein